MSGIGAEMTSMLQALRHRGPDSTGFAIYGTPAEGDYVMRFKVAEQEDMASGFDIHAKIRDRLEEVDRRLAELGVTVKGRIASTEYAMRYVVSFDGDMEHLARYVEDVEGAEILSLGGALELVKDLGDATVVSEQYDLGRFRGTHGIGHTRMATESDVDIRSAHPYWAFPYNDVAVVHNGQITNYWLMRREMERKGHRFMSDCDSELLAVYIAHNLSNGVTLEDSLERSVREIDGVFTYLVATRDQLGMAKDTMAAKPLVLYESDDLIALASRRSRSAPSSPKRSTPTTPTTRRPGYGRHELPGRSLLWDGDAHRAARGPDTAGLLPPEEEERFLYPWAPDVDYNKRTEIDADALTSTEVNSKLRALMNEGYGPSWCGIRAASTPSGRDPQSAEPHLRGFARLLRDWSHRRSERPHPRPRRLVVRREHDGGHRAHREERRLDVRRRDPRRRSRMPRLGRLADRDRHEGGHHHRRRRYRRLLRLHDAARAHGGMRQRGEEPR